MIEFADLNRRKDRQKNLRRRLQESRGFTLVELLVGLGILGLVVVGLVVALINNNESRQLERAKSEIRQQADYAAQLIQSDFESLARSSGSIVDFGTTEIPANSDFSIFWAIERLDLAGNSTVVVRPDGVDFDGLQLYRTRSSELAAAARFVGASPMAAPSADATWFRFAIRGAGALPVPVEGGGAIDPDAFTDPAVIRAYNAKEFIRAAAESPEFEFFILSTDTDSIVVRQRLSNPIVNPQGDELLIDFALPNRNGLDYTSFFQNRSIQVRLASRVTYRVFGNLLRRTELSSLGDGGVISEIDVVDDVDQFLADFYFADRRPSFVTPLTNLPSNPISHPNAEGFDGLSWADVSGIRGRLVVARLGFFDEFDSQNLGGPFAQEANNLLFFSGFDTSLSSYDFQLGDPVSAVGDECFISNPSAQCNPECSESFNNQDDPMAPDGVDRGDLNSDFCRCGREGDDPDTSPQLFHPESQQNYNSIDRLAWDENNPQFTAVQERRAHACIRALATDCQSNWRQLDPRATLLCNHCIFGQSRTNLYNGFPVGEWTNGNFSNWGKDIDGVRPGWNEALFNQLGAYLHDIATREPDDEHPREAVTAPAGINSNELNCINFPGCDGIARFWFPGSEGSLTAKLIHNQNSEITVGAFRKLCACETHRSSGGSWVSLVGTRQWAYLCSPAACPMHVDNTGTYTISNVIIPNEHGLTPDDARYCECRNLPANQIGAIGSGTTQIPDFRDFTVVPNLLNDAFFVDNVGPTGGVYSPHPNNAFASSSASIAQVQTNLGPIAGGNCTQAECFNNNVSRPNIGCCVERTLPANSVYFDITSPDRASDSFLLLVPDEFSGYCDNDCLRGDRNLGLRRSIFNPASPPPAPPAFCSANDDSASGGDGFNVP